MNKFRNWYHGLSKKGKIIGVGVLAIIIIVILGKVVINYQNNNIVSKIEVSFDGYNGSGQAEMKNYKQVGLEMAEKIGEKKRF